MLSVARRLVACAAVLAWSRGAAAQSTILHPSERPADSIELEPHLLATPFNPPGDGSGAGFGVGGRASFEVVRHGFVPSINDSVSVGVGIDFMRYQGSGVFSPGVCTRTATGPAGTGVCVEVSQRGGPSAYLFLPVTMQWNFWLTRQWSVFGEPGLSLYWFDYRALGASPVLFLGGRFHFTDRLTLTMRVGYPTFSIGVSLLF